MFDPNYILFFILGMFVGIVIYIKCNPVRDENNT